MPPALTCLLFHLIRLGPPEVPPDGGARAAIEVEARRSTTLELWPPVGSPVELRPARGGSYALAILRDRDERWAEAWNLYQAAVEEWNRKNSRAPHVDLEEAIHKASWEQRRSQLLGSWQQQVAGPPGSPGSPFALQRAADRARAYRLKMMAVRAYTGTLSPGLYRQARDGFSQALRIATRQRGAQVVELRLLLGATLAVGGELDAARAEHARLRQSEREDPANALALAVFEAAVGNDAEALEMMEVAVRRVDNATQREVYYFNDWDRLRANPRFERMFRR